MRIGLLTEGARPYATGETWLRCGRPVRGLPRRDSARSAVSHSAHRESRGRAPLPFPVNRVRTTPLRVPRGGGRREVPGGAAALPGPLAKRFFGGPLPATDRSGAAARARPAVAHGLAAYHGIHREPMTHAPVDQEAHTADAHGTPPPSAAPAATDPAAAPGSEAAPAAPLPEPATAPATGPSGAGALPAGAPPLPGTVPQPASVPAPAPVALPDSEPAPVPRRRRTARPDHGDRSMTRPDDPAIPAAPDQPAPDRPAGIAPRTTARRSPATVRRGPAVPVTAPPPHHRDPRDRAVDPSGSAPDTAARDAWTLLALLPGAACLATAGALRITEGDGARALVTVVGALPACLALRACLAHGPLRAPGGTGRAGLYACWLLSYAVYGEGLLGQVMTGGPDGWWGGDPAPLLGLAVAVAPAALCADLFTVRAHRERAVSRTPEESGAGVRPLLLATATLFLGALLPLLYLADRGLGGGGTSFAAVALGVLFFLARLLAAHGLPEPGAVALAAACAVEAAAPALVLSARLPGLEPVAQPVNALVSVGGTGAVGALACGVAALGLLLYAPSALSRAFGHTRPRT
ncbi:hypothetical protein [Streptomyces californicus]|uniref:hypothetical protein n=1 Tax=Streptomyces californicus TaxID=67351 RepID=UPI0037B8EDF5